ncbi:MAG: hypothetical protein CM1200mP30_22390 [Pseudomonadota bacterium]|nr:MAG: hypothetical protein CM1200mP30_22390 [Pseudomonadota bacterium]
MGFPLRAIPADVLPKKLVCQARKKCSEFMEEVARQARLSSRRKGIGGLACYYGADGTAKTFLFG